MFRETERPVAAGTAGRPEIIAQQNCSNDNDLHHRPQLRDYQVALIDKFYASLNSGVSRILIELATGGGKTVVFAEIIRREVERHRRVLLLAHRRELIRQASEKLFAAGIDHGIIQAGFPPRPGEPVQVGSVQTLHARAVRGTAMELPPADLIVIDEAHHTPARTYRSIVESYPDAILLGATATPCRGDGRGLGRDV